MKQNKVTPCTGDGTVNGGCGYWPHDFGTHNAGDPNAFVAGNYDHSRAEEGPLPIGFTLSPLPLCRVLGSFSQAIVRNARYVGEHPGASEGFVASGRS